MSWFTYPVSHYHLEGYCQMCKLFSNLKEDDTYRNLEFLNNPSLPSGWKRFPWPQKRLTKIPHIREYCFSNYCVRALKPEICSSWRTYIRHPNTCCKNGVIGAGKN